jgi:hypothetical protein
LSVVTHVITSSRKIGLIHRIRPITGKANSILAAGSEGGDDVDVFEGGGVAFDDLTGGDLRIDWPGPGHSLWMSGPAVSVFEGNIEL